MNSFISKNPEGGEVLDHAIKSAPLPDIISEQITSSSRVDISELDDEGNQLPNDRITNDINSNITFSPMQETGITSADNKILEESYNSEDLTTSSDKEAKFNNKTCVKTPMDARILEDSGNSEDLTSSHGTEHTKPNFNSNTCVKTPNTDDLLIEDSHIRQDLTSSDYKERTEKESNNSTTMGTSVSNKIEEKYMEDPSNNWLSHTEALIKETEIELNRLQSKVLQTDQSIYKLAFDELSTADHSEAEELPEPNVPNVTDRYVRDRSEIIVHEMDTASEAGSEDVELIPHRYESSSALEKHLYVNKLSLATELLRTKEKIPYDEEFKMIVQEGGAKVSVEAEGRVNQGFEEDSSAAGANRKSNISTVDSGVQSDESGDEGAVEAKEARVVSNPTLDDAEEMENSNTSSTSRGYRRFGARTFGILKGNPFPCWCCNVM